MIVDIKMAFDSEPSGIDSPKFASPAGLSLSFEGEEAFDVWGKPDCSNQWCFDRECHPSNMYMTTQLTGRTETTDNEIKPGRSFVRPLSSMTVVNLLSPVSPSCLF